MFSSQAEAISCLVDALNRCESEDLRTPRVSAALDHLEAIGPPSHGYAMFREGLKIEQLQGRRQNVNAALNAICLALPRL